MFWQTTEESSLDTLLKSENVILNSVLEDPYTLQELRNSNKNLLDYLCREEVLMEMIATALRPSVVETLPLKQQYKHSHICTEILTVPSNELSAAILCSDKCMKLIVETLSTPMNSVTSSFFMKIISHLFSRDTAKMLEMLIPSPFISLCLSQLHLSAISDCLLRVLTTPVNCELFDKTIQWYVDGGMPEGLINLMSPSTHSTVHYNVAYLYSEIIRSLRDSLYSSEDKPGNELLSRLQSSETVGKLMDKMLQRDSDGRVFESVVVNGLSILEALLDTNFIPNRPSHQLEEDRMDTWLGGIPDNPNSLDGHTVWQADAGRVVETVVVGRTQDIMEAVLQELNREEDDRGDSWSNLLSLLVEMVDTNWVATQITLHAALKKIGLREILRQCLLHPELSLLHRLVHKFIHFILHSACSPESPLLIYLFNDTDIVCWIVDGLRSPPPLSQLSLTSYKAFLLHLSCALHTARSTGPNAEHIDRILKASVKWSEVEKEMEAFVERNKTAHVDGVDPSACSSRVNDGMDDLSSSVGTQLTQSVLHEFESGRAGQQLPSHLNSTLSSLSNPLDPSCYSIDTRGIDIDISGQFTDSSIDECAFERVCSLRTGPLGDSTGDEDDWPRSANTSRNEDVTKDSFSSEWPGEDHGGKMDEEWPGEGGKKKGDIVEWLPSQISGQDLHDDWPSVEGGGGVSPSKNTEQESSSVWADFSSPRDECPPSEWSASMDPMVAGYSSLISAGIQKNNSQC